MEVDRGFRLEARASVYLKNPRVKVAIEKNVIAKKFEEITFRGVWISLYFLGCIKEVLLHANETLEYGVINSSPHQLDVHSKFYEMILKCR